MAHGSEEESGEMEHYPPGGYGIIGGIGVFATSQQFAAEKVCLNTSVGAHRSINPDSAMFTYFLYLTTTSVLLRHNLHVVSRIKFDGRI